jgi:hypothetical protein
MKIDPTTAHVCIRAQEVNVGDAITLYRNQCSNVNPKSRAASCELVKVGQGKITRILNTHYSEAQFPSDVRFNEGDVVEKE